MLASHLERFPSPDGLVFTGPGGGPLRPNNFRKRVFYPANKAAGLAHLRVHDLRHTCAAILFARGAPVKAVSDRLRHSNPTVTLNVYAHVIPGLDEQLVAGLEETFEAAKGAGAPSLLPRAEEGTVIQIGAAE